MTLTAWARARNEELQAELQVSQSALTAAQENERAAKAALAAAQKGELDAKVALALPQESEQATKVALAALQVEVAEAKAKQLKVEVAVKEEKAALLSSMESMMYHCWAFNQDGNFSFLAPKVWDPYLEKFKARILQEQSKTGDASTTGEQETEEVTSSERPGGA
ncbi:uncharacterized protein LOC133782738 [Humulus lupulus]|uniref:uncharacterized protein LOC133782738 n=1 Tax=Humulus lupulus TaxID=3486 RepID=UPI002B414D54|nr:uncharacterized protein LOC133782738 [Humulus lupulus]